MKKVIIYLIRKKLGLSKNQAFRFTNQKSASDYYYFTDERLIKVTGGVNTVSSVSLNWLLDDCCSIVTLDI